MNYTYIALTVASIAVIAIIAIFILRSDEAEPIRAFFTGMKKAVAPDPTSIDEAGMKNEYSDSSAHLHKNSWKVEIIKYPDSEILAKGEFYPEKFRTTPKDEREKHYFIGFSVECELHINATDITGDGELAYIRYDREKNAFYLWDTGLIPSVFSDPYCTLPIKKQNVKITDGLELFFLENYSVKFSSIVK